MKLLFIFFINIFNISFIYAQSSLINNNQWKQIFSSKSHIIYEQNIQELGLIAFKAEAILNIEMEKLITVLRDAKGSKKWSENLVHLEYINEISDLEAIVYEVRDFPWPFKDRDAVVKYKASINHERKSIYVTFNSINHPKYSVNTEYVRGILHYGLMEFWPRKDGTKIELTILADPKGIIPLWVVNLFQKSFPTKFITQMEVEASKSNRESRPGIHKLVQEYLSTYNPENYELSATY